MATANDFKNIVATRIKEKRIENGWSQTKLADMLGLKSNSSIANWETGFSAPDYYHLSFLADLFGVSADYLLGRDDGSGASAGSRDKDEPPEMVVKYECCDEIGRAAIDNCIDFHYQRSVSIPAEVKKTSSGRIKKLFLDESDQEYDAMQKKVEYLKALKKHTKKSYTDITRYLWACGYGGEICLAFILNVFGIGFMKRVPSQELYEDIEACLKDNWKLLSKVKDT